MHYMNLSKHASQLLSGAMNDNSHLSLDFTSMCTTLILRSNTNLHESEFARACNLQLFRHSYIGCPVCLYVYIAERCIINNCISYSSLLSFKVLHKATLVNGNSKVLYSISSIARLNQLMIVKLCQLSTQC